MASNTPPKYRRQRRKNQGDLAFVELNGRRFYLGPYGSIQSKQKYSTAIAEWESRGQHPDVDAEDLTIVELIDRFWSHVEERYQSKERQNFRHVLEPLKKIYGDTLDFWRVLEAEPGRRLRLFAEMKLPSIATLTFDIASNADSDDICLVQAAHFRPRGLPGILYWYAVNPFHGLVFKSMLRGIKSEAERLAQMASNKTAG